MNYFEGFSWAVHTAFADPLASCRFEQGDVLYDTRRAYVGGWSESLSHLKYSLQVKSPPRGTSTKSEKEEESAFSDNWNMTVELTLTEYPGAATREVRTTQGRLYTLLWKGDLRSIDNDSEAPPLPILAMRILRLLPQAVGPLKRQIPEISQGNVVFLMPYDPTRQLLKSKFSKVQDALEPFQVRTFFHSPKNAGLGSETDFAPTVSIACFVVGGEAIGEVEYAIKEALYSPSKDKKTSKEQFRIGAHGHLLEV